MRSREAAVLGMVWLVFGIPCAAAASDGLGPAVAVNIRDIDDVSIEDLLKVPITAAARHEQEVGEAASSATVITAEEIEAGGYETLAQVLRGQAGFYSGDDLNYASVGVRGFSPPGDYNMRILVLLDGHPLNDVVWSSASVGTDGPIDLDLVDRIEIARGPGSALYGTNAILAVVQIITKSAASRSSPGGHAETGSHGRRAGGLTWSGPLGGKADLLISASGMDRRGQEFHFHEFESTPSGGRTDHDDDRFGRFYASLRAGDLRLNGLYAKRTKHLPNGAWESIFDDPDTRAIDRRDFVEAVYSPRPEPGLDLTVRAFLDRYSSHGIWAYDASVDSTLGMEGRVLSRDESDVLWGGAEARVGWRASPSHRLTGGGGFHLDHGTIRNLYEDVPPGQDLVNLDIDQHVSFFSVYAQEEYTPRPCFSMTLGLHYDHYETWGGMVTPRIGLVVGPYAGTRGKLLYGKGFRAPSIGEAYYEDGATQVANPELEPERIASYEGVLERTWAGVFWTRASLYRNEMTDLIQLVERDDGLVEYRNDGSVDVNGVELDTRAVPRKGWMTRVNVSYQDAHDAVTGQRAWNSPEWTANAGVGLAVWKHRFVVGLDGRYVGDRIGANGVTAGGYAAADANLIWRTPVTGLHVALKIDNLTDEDYADPSAEGQVLETIPQYSRTWRLTIRFAPGDGSSREEDHSIESPATPERRGSRRDLLARLEDRPADR